MKHFLPVVLLILLVSACQPAAPTVAPPAAPITEAAVTQPAAVQPAENPLFTLVLPDGSERPVTAGELKALPQQSLTLSGSEQNGPKLADVLSMAGVKEYNQVIVTGTAKMTLTRAQISETTMLDFANRGTVKLASAEIPKNSWVKDITRIEVK